MTISLTDISTVMCPFPELNFEFPAYGFVIQDSRDKKFSCAIVDSVQGISYFSDPDYALAWALVNHPSIPEENIDIIKVTFDQAREIAKQRPVLIVALILLDNHQKPEIHYVR